MRCAPPGGRRGREAEDCYTDPAKRRLAPSAKRYPKPKIGAPPCRQPMNAPKPSASNARPGSDCATAPFLRAGISGQPHLCELHFERAVDSRSFIRMSSSLASLDSMLTTSLTCSSSVRAISFAASAHSRLSCFPRNWSVTPLVPRPGTVELLLELVPQPPRTSATTSASATIRWAVPSDPGIAALGTYSTSSMARNI